MDLRWLGSVALLAIVAVAALFLCPLAHGSYSATHGPTTTLRSWQLRAILGFVISTTGLILAELFALHLRVAGVAAVEATVVAIPCSPSFAPLRR